MVAALGASANAKLRRTGPGDGTVSGAMKVILASLLLVGLAMCRPVPEPASDSLAYLLQPASVSVAELAAARFHWLVLEPTRDGQAGGDYSAGEIDEVRTGGACRKIVLAYLSIGEAEDYRSYWDPAWVAADGTPIAGVAPAWLGPLNPDWPGNYKVRYWDPDWQDLLLGTSSGPDRTPLDRILDQGFDGVYLDVVDAYEYWSTDEGGAELSREEARHEMIGLIRTIADYARGTRGRGDFLVFPQNAADIIRTDDDTFDASTEAYFAAISGIGQEDLFYDGLVAQPAAESAYVLDQLREFVARDKTVLVTDYVVDRATPGGATNAARVADFVARCRAEGFVPYAAYEDRALDALVTLDGEEWPVAQPPSGCP